MISMAIRMATIGAHSSDFITCSVVNAAKDLGREFGFIHRIIWVNLNFFINQNNIVLI